MTNTTWIAERVNPNGDILIENAPYDIVATVWSNKKGYETTARLIAAAPELLIALQALVDHAQETYPHFESLRGQADIGCALYAIKRATGRE